MIATLSRPAPQDVEVIGPRILLKNLLACMQEQQPLFVWGGIGIGKSQIVRQAADLLYAEHYGYRVDEHGHVYDHDGIRLMPYDPRPWFIDIRASLLDPVDLRGLPRIEDEPHVKRRKLRRPPARRPRTCARIPFSRLFKVRRNVRTTWVPPSFLPGPDWVGLIFLDELNRAATMVLNGLLQFALDRKLGEYALPRGAAVVAAGNRESDGGGVQRMPSALAGRFLHVYLEPSVLEWCDWAVVNDIHPLIVAFHRYCEANPRLPDGTPRPNVFNSFDARSNANPNPRTWEKVSAILKRRPDKDCELSLVAGLVGRAEALAVLSFIRLYRDLPNMASIIANPTTAPVPTEVSQQYAVATALAARATVQNIAAVLTYLDRMSNEFAVYAVKDMRARDKALANTAEFVTWAVKYQDVLK